MFDNKLWHHALKLNKGIYKTTETVSDAEILKKQLREQSNEILSTISVFCSRAASVSASESNISALGGQDSRFKIQDSAPPDLHSAIANPNNSLSLRGVRQSANDEAISAPSMIHDSKFMIHNYFLPESEICLLLLLDKIMVLKTFLFLAKEHNFFSEEKHQILTAACEHLSESAQSELRGADIFSHSVFHSEPSAFASIEIQDSKFKIQDSPSQSSPSAPIGHIPDNLSDILDNIANETVSDNNETLSDTADKKAVNYISKSIKKRQNKSFKSYFPKFLNISPRQQNNQNPNSLSSFYASAEIPQNAPSPVAVETAPIRHCEEALADEAISFFIFPSVSPAPLNADRYPLNASPAPSAPSTHYQLPTTSPSASSDVSRYLTPRQKMIYNHLLQNNQSKIGDLTALFPEKISEKTIRRDLQVLINKSLVSQSGSRRWTYYSVEF